MIADPHMIQMSAKPLDSLPYNGFGLGEKLEAYAASTGLHEIDREGPECSSTDLATIRDLPRCDKFGSGHRMGTYLDGSYHVVRPTRRHRRPGGKWYRLRCPLSLALAVGCRN